MAWVKITYIGHASFCFESDKGTVIYFDPWLNRIDGNPTAKLKLADIKKADMVIATHGHTDHIGDSFEICKHTRARFIGSWELCLAAEAHGLKMGSRSIPMNPGGTVKLKDVQITLTQTHHSQSLSSHIVKEGLPKGLYFHPDGAVAGVVTAFSNGITIYDSADTCLFSDMQLIGQMYGPQIAILPVGGKFTMGIREGARAASFIRPDVVIPCHYGKIMEQPADIDELSKAVRFLSPNSKVVGLKPGQSLVYTASTYKVG